MRKSNNSNIFTGDRDYKTNFFLQFFSKQTEQKFRHENISRNRYSLQGFLIFSLCYHAISFMQSDCFLFGSCCHQVYLLLLTMITLIAALHFTQKKISSIYIHLLLLPTTLYQQTLFMEKYNTDTGLLIAVVSTSLTSFLVHPVWFLQAFYSLCAYCLFFIYTRLYFVQNLLRKPELDVLLDLIVYNIIALTFLAFIEKDRKERWVLLDTFKKSERIFRQIYEELPYPMFVLEKNKKVLYANSHGVSLVSNYTKNCGSCNFAKKNVFLDKMVDQASLQVLENAMSSVVSTKEAMSCYVSLQNPTETISDDSVHKVTKDNHYKLTVSPGVWKKSLVFMVALRDYSTKRKSEAVSSKAVEGLVKDVEGVIKRCESHTTDNTNQKFKLELIAQANSLKLSILNTKILFNQIFEKKEGLKEEMNFNIQKVVLASIATLNQTFRHTNCSIQLRFEPSFPQAVLGDEFLFEQIFSNALSLFLKKLNKTKVSVDCKLCSLTADGKYLLSFEFEIPKNNQLAYDPLQSHLDATRVATLDHFVDDDAILFGLALIRPGIELLEGTSELEEGQNVVCLSIKLPFKTQDNSKQTNPSLFQTFELTDYDSSSKPSLLTYYWDPVQSTRTSVILDCPREPKELGGSYSGANNSLLKKTLEESFRRGHSRTSSFEKSPGRTSLEAPYKNKFIEELQKIKTENIKNFGNVNQAQSTHSPDLSTSSTVVQNYATFEKQKSNDSNISLYIEEKKELEKDKSKKQTPKIYLSRADDMEITNYDDQSDRESVQNFLRTYQSHELNVKLALAKALASILDGHKRRGSQKSQTSDLGSTLELVTLEKRMKGKWIDERKLYVKTVRYLSSKLEEEQYRERFLTFLEQDVESLRRDLEPAQEESLCALPKSLANTAEVVIENSPIPIVRRAVTSNVKEFMTFRRRSSVTSHLTPDTGRSKERSLNERFLLSPSVSRTVSISNQSRKSIFMEISKDSDSQGMSEDRKIELENKIMEKKKSEKLKRDLCPFTADKVPVALILRSHRHIRKWQSIGTSVESGATKKVFNYNDVFTILVTDDSNFVLKAVTALPLKYKTKLEFANNGTEALKKYLAGMEQGIMFHLILMDLQMPVMDGFEATRNIRDEEFSKQYPQTYICAMSAFEEADLTARVRREGINNFVQKPLRLEVLNNLIKTRCEEIGIPLQE